MESEFGKSKKKKLFLKVKRELMMTQKKTTMSTMISDLYLSHF